MNLQGSPAKARSGPSDPKEREVLREEEKEEEKDLGIRRCPTKGGSGHRRMSSKRKIERERERERET